jgi:hypothetical protein
MEDFTFLTGTRYQRDGGPERRSPRERNFRSEILKGRAPAALRIVMFEEMVPEAGVEPARF